MNKCKIAFWICLTALLFVTVFSIYANSTQAFDIVKTSQNYSRKVEDLNSLSKIINETDFTKSKIKKILRSHKLFGYMNFEKDTISLESINLIFTDNKLVKVINLQQ